MTSHRKQIERRPLYAALTLAVVSVGVILVFGATAGNTPPIFNATQAQANVAPSIVSAARPSLIPLPTPPSVGPRPVTPVKAAKPAAALAAPTPFATTYRPLVSAHSQAGVIASSPQPSARITSPAERPHPTPRHSTRRPTSPMVRPIAQPTPHPSIPSGSRAGRGDGNELPWWWYPVPHDPSFPRFPVATHTYSFPGAATTDARHSSSGSSWHHSRR